MTAHPLPIVDLDVLDGIRAVGGSGEADLLTHFVRLFLDDAQALVAEALLSCTDEDRAGVERSAHALRGAAGLIGARRLSGAAEAVERAAEHGSILELERLAGQLETALHELQPALLAAAGIAA